MKHIYSYTEDMLKDYMISLGEKPYRSSQIMEWLYRFKVKSFDEMTNISKKFIEILKNDFIFDDFELAAHQISKDGTQKFLFKLSDGNLIE